MQRQIEAALASHDYDLVIASQGAAAEYGSCFQGVPALYEEVELGVFYEQYACATSTRARLRYGLTWLKHRCHLARQLRHFRACTVVSAQERNLLLHAAPHCVRVEVIPNSLNLADYAVARAVQPNTLIFTGPFVYRVNYNAMCWFLTEIYPKVQAQEPDVHLTITGDHAGLPLPAAANVTLTGCVDDVRPLIASSCVSLAPLLEGGGTRLKILEAMALRTPVVATHKGAEGLNARSGEHLLIADTPAEFAQSVVRLCRDSGLRQRLGNSAYSFVSAEYSWAATMPRFLNLIERVAD
jgi:glycosyltransferase involved in cell wall biosynthesis